jgi:hypothetical protein
MTYIREYEYAFHYAFHRHFPFFLLLRYILSLARAFSQLLYTSYIGGDNAGHSLQYHLYAAFLFIAAVTFTPL